MQWPGCRTRKKTTFRLEDTLSADSVDCGNYVSEEPAADPVVESEVTV